MSNALSPLGGSSVNALGEGPGVYFFGTPLYNFTAPTLASNYVPSSGVATFDPNAMAALQNTFVNTGANALSYITNIGALEYSSTQNLFNTWGNSIGSLGQQSANIAQEVANKSAKACSGFFGCLF